MRQDRVTDVLPVQSAREDQKPASTNNDASNRAASDATNRLLEGDRCSACTTSIRQEAQRLICWLCKAQYHFNCMLYYHTQIVRTQMIQRWQCTHCSKKPVSDSEDNQEAKVLDKKRPSVHQPQLRIIQWNAKIIHRELPLLQDLLEANNVDVVCTQETKLQPKDRTPELRRFSAVRRDRPVQVEARWRHYDLCSKQIPGSLNGKNFVSQIQKADGFIRLHRDVSDLKFEKHERNCEGAK